MTDQTRRPALCEHTIRVLLLGYGAPLPRGCPRFSALPADAQAEFLELWRGGAPAVAHAWREHAALLRVEAQRLGVRPMGRHHGKAVFFAEAIAAREPR